MIEFFDNPLAANAFCGLHPEWKPVSVSAGHTAGSVLVLFEARPDIRIDVMRELVRTVDEHMPKVEYNRTYADKPKRGRPPKVKSA